MKKDYIANMSFTANEFAVIWELLQIIRLGSRNIYEEAISDLCIALEKSGTEDKLNRYYQKYELSPPKFRFEASDEDGVVINVE